MTNTHSILNELSRLRGGKVYTSPADLTRITEARKTGDWQAVKTSRLYRLHGGEYCTVLELTL